jgi:hypothetical protein
VQVIIPGRSYFHAGVRPNPTAGLLELVVNSTEAHLGSTIAVFDVLGRVVLLENADLLQGYTTVSLDLSHLADAHYVVRIQTPSGYTFVQKVVKSQTK